MGFLEIFSKPFKQNKPTKTESNIEYKAPTQAQFYEHTNSPITKKHFHLLDREIVLYKHICQTGDCSGSVARELIEVCNEDIAIADEYRVLCNRCNQPVPRYPAFKYLAMLFEKRGEYRAAISTCEVAIAKGHEDDGTKGGMQGRIERLRKKV